MGRKSKSQNNRSVSIPNSPPSPLRTGWENKKTDEFKESIKTFIDNMGSIPDWYDTIQKRGNGHVMMSSMGIKVDDYEYWANAHKEEYLMKYNDGNLDLEGLRLRHDKFEYIVLELEKVIKKAAELGLNITKEMHHDYCAARASLLAVQYTLKEIEKIEEDKSSDINTKIGYTYNTEDGKTYYLNTKEVELTNGRMQTIYFFSSKITEFRADIPKGTTVFINKDGLPYLAKEGTPDKGQVKYLYRLELNVRRYPNNEEIYRYDVYEAYLPDFPDGYGSFVKNDYNGDHISSADDGNVFEYPFFQGKYNEDAESELNDKYDEEGYTENIDEFGAFESFKDIENFISKDADKRFPNSGFLAKKDN